MITDRQQKLYDLSKAEKLLDKHGLLEKSQKNKINNEKNVKPKSK